MTQSNTDLLKSIYQAVYGDLSAPGRLASLEELVEITAYSIGGQVKPGSIITGQSVRCDCGLLFVPHHPRQKYCSRECPARNKKKG